ncbi:glycosyltransferase family 2 protein [Paenibacillus sp. J2TS4]|uniref:glycosyltransferase family 2 protein n=1 Tax=Paenibacillus sp. J2TS4 TaxID=2807194 RepID=UPI001B23DD21|nr:glycosyltransferase family 2 protein [Paenibacillus sp. J2TS4]GIP32288.1 glycosyl transferase [Paenibacillus sp. J2TS4]
MSSPAVSVIIPAWNEERTITATLRALRPFADHVDAELIVVDDGSSDRTADLAEALCHYVVRHAVNKGKGAALQSGLAQSNGEVILFLDADLRETAAYANLLLQPVLDGRADMSVACFVPRRKRGGFGLVKRLARYGIEALSGYQCKAPLSGQRAIKKSVLERIGRFSSGFGVEVGMTIDAAVLGFRIVEVDIPFCHRLTGNDVSGWTHRGRQFFAVGLTLWSKWRKPIC